jgi:hypothetical protein
MRNRHANSTEFSKNCRKSSKMSLIAVLLLKNYRTKYEPTLMRLKIKNKWTPSIDRIMESSREYWIRKVLQTLP